MTTLHVQRDGKAPPLGLLLRSLAALYPDSEAFKAEDDDGRNAGGHQRHQDDDFDEQYMREFWALMEVSHSNWITALLRDLHDHLAAPGYDLSIPLNIAGGDGVRLLERLAAHTVALLRSAGIDSPVLSASRPVALIAADIAKRAPWAIDLIEYSYRLGRAEMGPESPWSMSRARAVKMTSLDEYMVDHIKARGGAYMRRVAHTASDLANQKLLEADREAVSRAMLNSEVATISPAKLTSYMAELTGTKVRREHDGMMVWRGGRWSRDWRRVARTEMAFAHSYGALTAAIAKHPDNASKAEGEPLKTPDVLAFKQPQTVARNAKGQVMRPCKHCHRIWYADDATPRLIPLKEIMANGENVGRRASEWVATVGPTHPNDLCGPLRFYSRGMAGLYAGFDRQVEKFKGQGFDGVDG